MIENAHTDSHLSSPVVPKLDVHIVHKVHTVHIVPIVHWAGVIFPVFLLSGGTAAIAATASGPTVWHEFLPPSVLLLVAGLLACSAFFSSCETAFLSIHKVRIRALREEPGFAAQSVVRMLDNPGRLLTTILVGNMLVNTLIGVILGTRVTGFFEQVVRMPAPIAYIAGIVATTAVLLFFGEITPKVLAVRLREAYALVAVIPLMAVDRALTPVCTALLRLTDFLFQVTHFHKLRAAPFITDEELKSALSDDDATAVIEEDGREMIRRILGFHDVSLQEILIPRPDMIALPEDATVAEAHATFLEHEYSRVPIYKDDLDDITGVLFAKDLLPSLTAGQTDRVVKTLARPPHFVPHTMSVQGFIKDVQRLRSHLAVVVDEYGGTKGIVTLHDAIEQVVGDIQDEGDDEPPPYEQLGEGVFRVDGGLPLDELSDLIGIPMEDEEHNTVAGFLMDRGEKVLSEGDQIQHGGMLFTVEAVDGKRASTVRIEIVGRAAEEQT